DGDLGSRHGLSLCAPRAADGRCVEDMDARLADDDGLKTREIEQIGEGLVAQIEASRIGAEGRQDATARIRGEATPPQSPGARREMRYRVQMAGNLALHTRRSRAWFVTGGDAPDMAGKRMGHRKPRSGGAC